MAQLTQYGQQAVNNLAMKYNLSFNAVNNMLISVSNGGGSMAQFNEPELGGSGQWMMGGMTMTGDMFNHGLNATVSNLCTELSNLLNSGNEVFVPLPRAQSNTWWPAEFGNATSSGAQNNMRYAFFAPPVCRLVLDINGSVSVYNTLNHQISGVSQQQGGTTNLQFTSQFGYVNLLDLPMISGEIIGSKNPAPVNVQSEPLQEQAPVQPEVSSQINDSGSGSNNSADVFDQIERLGDLMSKGYITTEEFETKKKGLLDQI